MIYLERKYEQEFEILKMVDETIAFSVPNYQADCIPKGGNQETECFTVWILPNGKLSFDSSGVVFDDRHAADNYFGVLIKPEIERLLREIVSKYFDDTEIRITLNSRYEYELNESSQYVDFIDRGYHILTGISILNVAYNEEETLRLIHEMYVDFKKSGLDVWGQVYYSYKNEESQTVSSRITMDTEKV
ncbi:MAG: hypothetical protein FWG90_02335 [Oscillospiraceae bacterium]|nr:hypothetical protein [Oscillospiraceae bacterium]